MQLQTIDLRKVVLEISGDVTFQIQEANAKLHIEPFNFEVRGHEVTMRTALTNLLTNAVKFTKPNVAPEIRIRPEERGQWVRLWIEDNGIGIAPQYHHQIFGVFHRLHQAEQYAGTGVGLAIVQKGIERMGGRVGVESQEGVGSRFWIELKKSE